MKYLSVCSGIEAATQAWHPLGWKPFAFSEIEKFPSAVLAHHYPHVPNFGDMTKFRNWPDAAIDILVGGTPCQSFSVAGLRKGLADPRGNLALTYLAIADCYRPEWLLWENVPGVLSSGDGRDFGAFLGGLVELGYGFAYRVLDAQYVRVDGFGRAVPQRRRRVFVVGCAGGWRRAAAVLFDAASLRGDSAPRRQSGQRPSPTLSARTRGGGGLGTDFDLDGGLICADVAPTLNAHFGDKQGLENQHIDGGCGLFVGQSFAIQERAVSENTNAGPQGLGVQRDHAYTLEARRHVQAVAFPGRMSGTQYASTENLAPSLCSANPTAVAYDLRGREGGAQFEGPHDTANVRAASGGSSRSYVAQQWAVRRLTPREAERLQGFPDDFTLIPQGNKLAADGPRYKALGNSMACNVMRWIGWRLESVRAILASMDAA